MLNSMAEVLHGNPLAWRLVHRTGGPSLRATLLLAAALAVIMAGLSLLGLVEPLRPWFESLLAASGALVFAAPLVLAPLVAIFVGQDRARGAFDLLLLTGLSSGTLVLGYIYAAAYRFRLVLALAAGALVLPAAGALWPALGAPNNRALLDYLGALYWWLVPLAALTGLWYTNLVAITLGARVGLRWGPPAWAGAIAALLMLLVMGVLLLLALPLLWLVTATSPWIFGGFSIVLFLYVPHAVRAGQLNAAAAWIQQAYF